MTYLGVNIDHIATIRQARRAVEPDPVSAAVLAELAGAHGITVHLRGDRRHILDRDVRVLRETITTRLNVEMSSTDEMTAIALELLPDTVTLVPEREDEVTTEGGLDLSGDAAETARAISTLGKAGLEVSLFIDPDLPQIDRALDLGAPLIELNTAAYADAVPKGLKDSDPRFQSELRKLRVASEHAAAKGLKVLAGHGLTYRNVRPVSDISQVVELNIGHNIVSRSALVGIERAVREMLAAMNG